MDSDSSRKRKRESVDPAVDPDYAGGDAAESRQDRNKIRKKEQEGETDKKCNGNPFPTLEPFLKRLQTLNYATQALS